MTVNQIIVNIQGNSGDAVAAQTVLQQLHSCVVDRGFPEFILALHRNYWAIGVLIWLDEFSGRFNPWSPSVREPGFIATCMSWFVGKPSWKPASI